MYGNLGLLVMIVVVTLIMSIGFSIGCVVYYLLRDNKILRWKMGIATSVIIDFGCLFAIRILPITIGTFLWTIVAVVIALVTYINMREYSFARTPSLAIAPILGINLVMLLQVVFY